MKKRKSNIDMFKIIIWSIILVFTVFIGYKVIYFIIDFIKTKQLVDIKEDIKDFVNSDKDTFQINYNGIKYICFSNSISEKELKRFSLSLTFSSYLNNLKDSEELKELIKNGQAPIIIVLKDDSWKKFYVDNLLISPDSVPKCFKNGDIITKVKHLGYYNIEEYKKVKFNYK